MPLLGSKAVPDVDGTGDRLADLAGMVQHPGDDVLPDAHGCQVGGNRSPQVVRRRRVVRQPEIFQSPLHGMCNTMRREVLLTFDQSRSRPAREEEWRFARQLRCLPEELHSHRRQWDGMISAIFYTPCRDQPLGLVEIDLRLKGPTDLADPLPGDQGEAK